MLCGGIVPVGAGGNMLELALDILSPACGLPGIFHSKRERCLTGPLLFVNKEGRGSGHGRASAGYPMII